MKGNSYKNSIIILYVVIGLIILAVVAAAVIFVLRFDETEPVLSKESDTAPVSDSVSTDAVTESDIITESESATQPLVTEPEIDLSFDEQNQLKLDEKNAEIAEWIKIAVPEYKTETDTEVESPLPADTYKPNVAFYYEDIESGCSMEYNADHVFYTASVIKAPYVFWALTEIEKAENADAAKDTKFDLERTFVYTEDKFKSGSGVIQKSEYGTAYTYYDLFRLAITESDNIAFAELRNVYGRKGFNEFSESIGVYSPAKKLYSASSREMGAYLREINKYFQSGTKYAEALRGWMLDTNHRIMIPGSVSPIKAANKYGWDLDAYHDAAIVFDEKPYLLVIMTELENGSRADNSFIRELVMRINSAHREIIGGVE